MMKTIKETNFKFDHQTGFYRGKVRDAYTIDDQHLVIVASDRISAFDVVLPEAIPYKGQVLNQLAANSLEKTKDIVPNWVKSVPDPNVTIGILCEPIRVEMVIRGYLAGHAWRTYKNGEREICGEILPEGLRENDNLPQPIITPTTKASVGHDVDISRSAILANGIVNEEIYNQIEKYTKALFQRGSEIAKERGLILVDTKYEFGTKDGIIYLIDEIHTPDSSRYFYSEGYEERQAKQLPQKQLSKEFVRQWLLENGFQGKSAQSAPTMSQEVVESISQRYIELYEQITGEKFEKQKDVDLLKRVQGNIEDALLKLR